MTPRENWHMADYIPERTLATRQDDRRPQKGELIDYCREEYPRHPNVQNNNFIITIDGPTAAGKSSAAALLAEKLGILHVKGSVYFRAMTFACIRSRVINKSQEEIIACVHRTKLNIIFQNNRTSSIEVNGEDVDCSLDSREISNAVSCIAEITEIRSMWIIWLRSFSCRGSFVVDGRTMGTEVFPKANLKFWLNAAQNIRAKRLANAYGTNEIDLIKNEMMNRDNGDQGKTAKRLIVPDDAIQIDSSEMTKRDVLRKMLQTVYKIRLTLNRGCRHEQ